MPRVLVTKIPCTCLHCGKVFEVYPSRLKYGEGKYCSGECSGLAHRIDVSETTYSRKPKSNTGRRITIYTSTTCQYCGSSFTVSLKTIHAGHGLYCSASCSMKAKGNNRKFSRGANWRAQSRLARERDKHVCRICGSKAGKKKLDVHHIIPFKEFNGDYLTANQLSNLITLCRQCHTNVENGKARIPNIGSNKLTTS